MIIKVDSREQLPLPWKVEGNVKSVLTVGLPFGDYWCAFQDRDGKELNEMPIVFERKGVEDLLSTMTSGNERFQRELERANKVDCKLYVIVEGTLSDVIKAEGSRQVKPGQIIKTIFTFKVKYGLETIFCDGRQEMMRYMIETWEAFGRNFGPKLVH